MNQDDRTYVIDPDATDPDLIRKIVPLGENPELEPQRSRKRRRRVRREPNPTPGPTAPRRPTLHLIGAYAAGPLAILLDSDLRRRRGALIAMASTVLMAGTAALAWTYRTSAGGDRAMLMQLGLAILASVAWFAVWAVGLVRASRRCGVGPFSRRGDRRPVLAGLAGLAAPGLGLLLAGRIKRMLLTLILVGCGLVAGLGLWRAPSWWLQHRAAPHSLLTDLQFEYLLVAFGGLAVIGLLSWLVSALEAGRVANGPVVVRRLAGADRVPALLLVALVAFGVFFRPGSLAGQLDRLTSRLVAAELQVIPLATARAATILAPAEPGYELRLAERYEDLGRTEEATAIRAHLAERWDRYLAGSCAVVDSSTETPVTIWAPATVAVPRPFAPSQTVGGPDQLRPAP